MSTTQIIDTFAEFTNYWSLVKEKSTEYQVDAWASDYLSSWPELVAKQVENYREVNLDWRQIACEKVFPFIADRLPAIQQAHNNLLELCEPVYSKVQQSIGFEEDVIFIIYIGIGCGAGWATKYHGTPAILFGLENIAESGWSEADAIKGLIAHEIGHLVHNNWRIQSGKPLGSGSWWQLYEEGFAQYFEGMNLGSNPWRQEKNRNDNNWLSWCKTNKNWLATEFIRMIDSGEPTTSYFGSWFDICGRSETGYFLGYEVIKKLEERYNLKEIALFENIEEIIRPALRKMMQV
jgi:hypothetical protein